MGGSCSEQLPPNVAPAFDRSGDRTLVDQSSLAEVSGSLRGVLPDSRSVGGSLLGTTTCPGLEIVRLPR